MKKATLIGLVLLAVIFSSCSTYTCPTYAKRVPVESQGKVRV